MTYKQYLKSKKLKPNTIRIYLWHIDKFLLYLGEKKLSIYNFNKYYEYLLENYKKIASINIRLSIINNYLRYKENNYRFNLLTAENRKLNILTKEQIKKLLEFPLKQKKIINLRDKVLLELLYHTGLKVKIISKLKKDNIDYIKNELFINKKSIPPTPETWFYLKEYLKYRKDDNPYLFISLDKANTSKKRKNKNTNLSIRSIERTLEKYSRFFIPSLKITPEILRDTLAFHIKNDGGNKRIIQDALHFKTMIGAEKYFEKL